ncbi:membrane protein [Halomonas citrativorans]|uniref:Low temperature requirement protein A n=1 Tax=Halomonas citrativorans TaxID=2742612 RepID=A0A1R4HPV2_9GAMM|nr:low temperature requirement protein A [Halomonas citrativorans]MBE0402262.1 low temperature requirement protein A [Halomonas citrativorans]SJN09558.1 membrane protein [Halomonas citrativorans]
MEINPILIRLGILPLVPRDPAEPHRGATPLELLFDLVSVIAVASAASGLHHAILAFHITEGVLKFSASFFAIWWAWMNFTWYASAYDNNDSLHRVLTIVAMAGSLIMAAGIDRFFQTNNIDMIVAGFVVMRLAMVCFWLRAARHDPERRLTAYRYAVGIAIVQVYWVGLMLAQPIAVNLLVGFYAVGALFELIVPAYAESNNTTPWHRRHLIERYGLLNIIVLGETLLAGSLAIQRVASDNMGKELIGIAISSLVLVFALWWVYFSQKEHVAHPRLSLALLWGYGHLLIYMSGAAVGVGVAVLIEVVTGYSSLSTSVGLYTIAVAISGYLFGLWVIRERFELEGAGRYILLLTAIVLLFSPLILPIEGIAALLVIGVAIRNQYACKSVKQETPHGI